jgi:hypothetical protein
MSVLSSIIASIFAKTEAHSIPEPAATVTTTETPSDNVVEETSLDIAIPTSNLSDAAINGLALFYFIL